ncbi:MAG TPA: alpha/beta hydrolase [Nocardioides sp.]
MRGTIKAGVAALALALTAGLATTLTGAAEARESARSEASPTGYVAPPIEWGRCADESLRQAGARCGRLVVPLDHARPDGPTISLAVSLIRHTSDTYRGVMFTNPGGPGGSGLWMARLGAYVPNGVGRSYDWIGLDPRGVGDSRPRLTCDGSYFGWDRPPYRPKTSAIMRAWLRKTAAYAKSCGSSRAQALLPHLRTVDTVADFEVLRQTLGVKRVGFYGGSYGTYIAQVYATQHPSRIKRMVLDGVVNPHKAWYAANLGQAVPFERVMTIFFRWIARHRSAYHLGATRADVTAAYHRLKARLTKRPAGGIIGPDEFDDALLPAGYNVYYWPEVAGAFSKLSRFGAYAGVKRLYRSGNPSGPGADNGYAIYLATQCTDAQWPSDWSKWRTDNWRLDAKAPYLTWSNAWYNAPCRTWPAASHAAVKVSGAAFPAPVLLVSETLDAATPYSGALAVRRLFPTSALVAGKGGTTHAAGLSGVPCVDNAIARYLATGALPRRTSGDHADLVCSPLPQPGRVTARQGRLTPLPFGRW